MTNDTADRSRKNSLFRSRRVATSSLVLLILTTVYIGLFTVLAYRQHAGLRTHKADLGQIDQAIWNSSRGRFVEMTDNGYLSTRLIDHVEPILALVSPVFWFWNDVRAILLLQVIAVAVGAWLLFTLARVQMVTLLSVDERAKVWLAEPVRRMAGVVALALATAYLLTPQLQSAILTEFHAIPLATPLILWAFWAVASRRWIQFALATILVALVKEEAALLAAALAVWAMWRIAWEYYVGRRRVPRAVESAAAAPFETGPFVLAAGLCLASMTWFYVATFVIVPAHAVEVYGVAESHYFRRYGRLGDSPLDIAKSMFTQPQLVSQIATEPARLDYLRKLAMPYGFMALLAPEIVLLSLPVLLANLLSAYPAQYYGEFHYSAPVTAFYAAGAAYGAARLWRWANRRAARTSGDFQHLPAAGLTTMNAIAALRNSRSALRPLITALIALWIVTWSVIAYVDFGRGPGGGRYDVTSVNEHHRLLSRFLEQIPDAAPLTASASVHPHTSHRRYVYQFPTGLDSSVPAEWALLDVTTDTDMAPGDLRARVEEMLAGEWGVVDAADGIVLLSTESDENELPASFYDFARTPTDLVTDDALQFLGSTVDDWPRWRRTAVTTDWRVGEGFDAATMLPQIELRTPTGETLWRFADANPPARIWYTPDMWQPGDEINVTTLPMHLPRDFGVVVEKTPGLGVMDAVATSAVDESALAAAYRRAQDERLVELPPEIYGSTAWSDWFAQEMGEKLVGPSATVQLPDSETIAVQAQIQQRSYWPGDVVDVWLQWSGEHGWRDDLSVFVHLRADDANMDQNDGRPRSFVKYNANEALTQHDVAIDWRQLRIPDDAVRDGDWTVVVGVYDSVTGARADLIGEDGQSLGQELVVGRFALSDAPTPDQACALIPDTCASQRK